MSDDFTNIAVSIDVIDSGYKMLSDALVAADNNSQKFELKDKVNGYINKKVNIKDEMKYQLTNILDNSLSDGNDGGKKHRKSRKTKKSKKIRKSRKNI